MELQLESQARQQLAARNQELQGLLVALERKQCEQKAQAQRREMELMKRIEQVSYFPLGCVAVAPSVRCLLLGICFLGQPGGFGAMEGRWQRLPLLF